MTELEFHPTQDYCIQTLARQEYERLKRKLLDSGRYDIVDGSHIEILKEFLETSDFNRIRREYEPSLFEGKRITFKLWAGPRETEYRWEIQ